MRTEEGFGSGCRMGVKHNGKPIGTFKMWWNLVSLELWNGTVTSTSVSKGVRTSPFGLLILSACKTETMIKFRGKRYGYQRMLEPSIWESLYSYSTTNEISEEDGFSLYMLKTFSNIYSVLWRRESLYKISYEGHKQKKVVVPLISWLVMVPMDLVFESVLTRPWRGHQVSNELGRL